MSSPPRIAIVYLSYHADSYLRGFFDALASLTYPRDRLEVVVVDHPHPEHGSSIPALERELRECKDADVELPRVTILARDRNRGFSHGVNAGIDWATENDCDYVYLHNDDGKLASDALEPLVEALTADPDLGAVQSLMLLDPDTHLVNSAGNALHYLFFGFCESYRVPAETLDLPAVKEIGFASGAASLLRVGLLREHGGFNGDLFLYCEDLEYCVRLRLQGKRIALVPASRFYHRYEFRPERREVLLSRTQPLRRSLDDATPSDTRRPSPDACDTRSGTRFFCVASRLARAANACLPLLGEAGELDVVAEKATQPSAFAPSAGSSIARYSGRATGVAGGRRSKPRSRVDRKPADGTLLPTRGPDARLVVRHGRPLAGRLFSAL